MSEQEMHAVELYHLGESKLETAKSCANHHMYKDVVELSYWAILYGVKAALAADDALPENTKDVLKIFKEFHVGSEAFPDEAWKRINRLIVLRDGATFDDEAHLPEIKDMDTQIESAEYILLLTNMFLQGKGIAL